MRGLPGTLQKGGAEFASTQWSLLLQCGREDSQAVPETCATAMEALCQAYWPPLYSFVRRRGYSAPDAQDLVQGFFVHLLEKRIYLQADPTRGKFRSFLLGSLKNFLANAHDHASCLKRGGGKRLVSLEEHLVEAEAAATVDASRNIAADDVFDKRWAVTLLARTWEELRAQYAQKNQTALLEALQPYLAGSSQPPPTQEEMAARLGMPVATVRTYIHRLRDRFRVLLREEVARTLPTGGNVEEELGHLRQALLAGMHSAS